MFQSTSAHERMRTAPFFRTSPQDVTMADQRPSSVPNLGRSILGSGAQAVDAESTQPDHGVPGLSGRSPLPLRLPLI